MDLKVLVRDVPDFPKPGIMFRDITPLLQNPIGLNYVINSINDMFIDKEIDYVVGIESRGFMFGTPLVAKLGAGFVPIRKPGKLPGEVHSIEYELEYGSDCLEMQQSAMQPGSRVLIVDDLIATGGTAAAAANLIQQAECDIAAFVFIIELTELNGRNKLPQVPVSSLIQY